MSVPTTWRGVGPFLWPSSSTKTPHIIHRLVWRLRPLRIDKTSVLVNHGHPVGNIDRLGNKTNQQISCCQTTIQEFGWRMEGRFLVKGNKDKRIPKSCCDGEENVDFREWNGVLFKLTYPNWGAWQSFMFCVCVPHLIIFVVAIILLSFLLFCNLSLVTMRNISFSQHPLSQDQLNLHFWIAITRVKIHL